MGSYYLAADKRGWHHPEHRAAIVQEALDSSAVAGHRELALRAALGFMVKDVWFEASLLYDPWIERFGLPDLAAVAGQSDRPYPAPVAP